MNREIVRLLSVLLSAIFILSLISCGSSRPNIENAIVEFWMSNDGGVTWTQRTFEQPAFGSIYLKVRIKVSTNRNRSSTHTVSLRINNSENINSRIIGGPVVNPRSILTAQIYEFTVRGTRNNEDFTELYVEFMSLGEGIKRMYLEFTDAESTVYDRVHQIRIVGSRIPLGSR